MSHGDSQPLTDASVDSPASEPTVGARLRAAREAQPLSLTQISAELRIEPKFLTALEEDRLDEFPAPVFTKGYLKQYGGLLGLDISDLLAQYYRQVDVRDVPVVHHKPIRLRDDDQIRHWLAATVVLCAVCGGLAAWWISQPDAEPIVVQRAAEPAGEQRPPTRPIAIVPPASEAQASSVDEFVAEPTVDEPTVEESTSPPAPAPAEAIAAADSVQIEVSFAEDCWTEITDANGERLFYGLGSAGARSRFSANLPISIFLGNAGGVELSLDGNRYAIPAGSRQGNLARFVIAESGP
jgi:cytoskeleton protein RodZ